MKDGKTVLLVITGVGTGIAIGLYIGVFVQRSMERKLARLYANVEKLNEQINSLKNKLNEIVCVFYQRYQNRNGFSECNDNLCEFQEGSREASPTKFTRSLESPVSDDEDMYEDSMDP